MDSWADHACPLLIKMAAKDREYQNILRQCSEQGEIYLRIVEKLSEDERETVDDYIAACEELGFRFAQLAYHLGILEGGLSDECCSIGEAQ